MSGRCAAAASPRSSSSGSADGSPWAGGRTPCSRRDRPQPTRSLLRKRRSFVRPQVLREPAANQNQGQCLIHAGHEHWSDTERKGFSGRIGVERLLQGPRTRHRLAASPARRKFPSARCRRAVSPRLWIALVYVNASFSWRASTALRPLLPARLQLGQERRQQREKPEESKDVDSIMRHKLLLLACGHTCHTAQIYWHSPIRHFIRSLCERGAGVSEPATPGRRTPAARRSFLV